MDDAYLELWTGEGARLVPLRSEEASIGRAETNDLALTGDSTVSRVHAVIVRYGGGWCVRDVGSTNGTFLNGQRLMGEQVLRAGDEIRIGSARIVFRAGASRAGTHATVRVGARTPDVTRREREILLELCRPLLAAETFAQPATNQVIAERLFVSEAAVKFHLGNLYLKFDLEPGKGSRRVQLATEAVRRGLVGRSDLQRDPS